MRALPVRSGRTRGCLVLGGGANSERAALSVASGGFGAAFVFCTAAGRNSRAHVIGELRARRCFKGVFGAALIRSGAESLTSRWRSRRARCSLELT